MPNRIIKESINESFGLSQCSLFAQDLYKRLVTYADDYGRFNADTKIMKARLYPREDEVDEEDVLEGLIELAGVGKIEFYRPIVFNHLGKTGIYGAFPNWNDHQRVRTTKHKCPDPDDTTINDWYLRRFVSIDKRAAIVERDKFKCCVCGKYVTTCRDAKRFVKMGSGMYHIDHIVPVLQGGRATMENLRLTCPECNLKRKRKYDYSEILEFSRASSPQSAASCGELPPESNPIRIQSESESKSEITPAKADVKHKYGEYQNVLLTDEEYRKLQAEFSDLDSRIEKLSEGIASKGYKYKSHYAAIRSWARRDAEKVSDNKPASFDVDEMSAAAIAKAKSLAEKLRKEYGA